MNNDTKPIHYLLYARKSSESEDRQVLSIDSQIDELKALAVRSEFTIAETRFEAHSAKAPGRPVFNLMLDDIERGKVDGIVVWHPDRLSRNSMDTGRLIYLFDLGKLREIVTPGQIFRNTPNDKFLLNLLCSQAKLENDNKSINIKRGLKAKADRGIYPAPAPVGYLNDRATERGSRIIRKDPERFDLVRRIFDTMLEGIYAPLQIMRIANEQWGFTMPNGKKLSRSTIYVILTRPFYCGRFEYPVGSGIWHKGIHEPIITESEYDRIQRMLGRAGKPRPQTHYFAFTAMINCAECGAYITAEEKTKHQKNGNVHHYTYYRCTKRKGLPCSQMPITEKKLADQIEEKLHTIDLPKGFKTWGVRWLEKTDQQTTGYTAETLASYEKALKQCEEKIDALIDMRAAQEITQDEFMRRRAVATAEKHRVEGLIANMDERKKKWLMKADEILDFATAAPKKFVKGDIETRKKMFRKLGSNLLLNNKILTISMGKPFVPLKIIAAEVKTIHKRLEPPETSDKSEDYERLYAQNPVVLRGQDSDLLRKLMGLPGKPFPTLPRDEIAARAAHRNQLRYYMNFRARLSKEVVKKNDWCDYQIMKTMKIAVLGFEREGQSTLKFLLRDPEFRGAEIWVLDKKEDIKVPKGVHAKLGADYMDSLNAFDIIFRTPGARYYAPELQQAIKKGAIVSSATKLFFDRCPARIVGVTGTKGKGTTSTLIYQMLKAGGKKVFLAGNIGVPALNILPKLDKRAWVVLELSSFQLIDMEKSPHIGVALMVTEEHLDWHKNIKEYVAAKANIVRFQSPADYAVIAEDYPRSHSYAQMTRGKVFTFSRHHPVKKGTWVQDGTFWFSDGVHKQKICKVNELHIPGEHNWENASAAITAGKLAGISKADIKRAITTFRGLEHRIEFVAKIKGVSYYNDSYSTMPDAAEVAMQAFAEPKILILGGSRKNADFSRLGQAISQSKTVKAIIGIGVEWPRIKEHIKNPGVQSIEGCTTMKAIVAAAYKLAAPGDVVLLSPGCASFGMFKNYTDRGNQFKAAVKKLR